MEDERVQQLEDQLDRPGGSSSRNSRRGGGGGRGGRGGRGGGGGAGRGRESELSHALSRLLRHQAENAGIRLDGEGYAPLDRVLAWGPLAALRPSFAEVVALVRDSDKKRFAMKPANGGEEITSDAQEEEGQERPPAGGSSTTNSSSENPADWLIRANQGHSIKLESSGGLLRPLALPDPAAGGAVPTGSVAVPPIVVHGTYFAFWPAIVASGGLKRMGRNHVHCSTGLPEDGGPAAVISGMRRDAELLVYVDVARSMREGGMRWWMSDNGVVLTEGEGDEGLVSTEYFKEVVGRQADVGVLFQDGEKLADLPAGLKGRVPRGKENVGRRGGGGRGRGRG